nr:unnamed protein product [Digitaria exilis]
MISFAFAARDSVSKSAGFTCPRRLGQQLVDSFRRQEPHSPWTTWWGPARTSSIGTARSSAFTNRLRPAADPSLDPAYAAQLNATCPPSYQAVNNSPVAPNTLSNQYYRNAGCCILTSDAALLTRSERHGGEGEHERVGRLDVVVVDGAVQGRGW